MSLLFRSPSLIIDGVEWHIDVRKRTDNLRPSTQFHFRLSERERWQPISTWQGRKPKCLRKFFRKYDPAVQLAMSPREQRTVAP